MKQPATLWRAAVPLFLLLLYGLLISTAVRKSATVDETPHLHRGLAYLREGATQFLIGNPVTGHAFAALGLLLDPSLTLPVGQPGWDEGDWSVTGRSFMWELNPNPRRTIFLGRQVTILITLLLCALVFRWGSERAGAPAGLIAFLLVAFEPNILAHAILATNDVIVTAFMTLSLYGFDRWSRTGRWGDALIVSAGLAAAALIKFNAAIMVPVLGLLSLYLAIKRRSARPIVTVAAMGMLAWLFVWGVYGFALTPLPGGVYWEDLRWQLGFLDRPHGVYLAGAYSPTGWWFYFIVAWLVKTPLPYMVALALSVVAVLRRTLKGESQIPPAVLWLAPIVYFGFTFINALNIGYRYLLPMLPPLALFIALGATRAQRPVSRIVAACAGGGVLLAILVWPNYLSYFNVLAGGPEARWQILSDSNIDWGQDLPALKEWLDHNVGAEPVFLSYFGTAAPSAYGLTFRALPTWPPAPEQLPPAQQPYDPLNPAPGRYAISVTNLHGAVLGTFRDGYAYFRDRVPRARIGGSIFVYEVTATGPPVEIAFGNLTPMGLDPEIRGAFQSNDLIIRWVDPQQALVQPAGGGWFVVEATQPIDPALPLPASSAFGTSTQALYALPGHAVDGPALPGSPLLLVDATVLSMNDGAITVVTRWLVTSATDRPVKLFAHALNATDEIVGQWDGLGVIPTSWRSRDLITQVMRFPYAAEPVDIAVGAYDGETGARYAIFSGSADTATYVRLSELQR